MPFKFRRSRAISFKNIFTHSTFAAMQVGLRSWGFKESDTNERLSLDGNKKRGFVAVKDLGQNSIAFFYLLGDSGD